MTNSKKLPVVVIACQVFQNLMEHMLPPDLVDQISFFDYGLHSVPKQLKLTIQDAVDSIKTPSLVVLGYGLCGNGLNGIKAGPHTLLIPRTDDCIAIFLGSYEAYKREFNESPGTYWLSKGWLESGTNPLAEYEKYVETYGEADAEWLMDQQYQHYKRLTLVAHTQADLDEYRPQAQKVADYCSRWNYSYSEMLGTDTYVRRLVEIAADLSRADDEFLVIPPGGELQQSQFMRGHMMPHITVIYGEKQETLEVDAGTLVGDAVATTGLPLEQPCAGRGTCGKCKVLLETGAAPPDDIEYENLTAGELAVGNRLACRARLAGDAQITLAPIVVYSNKIFRAGNRHRRDKNVPLGLAIDLGSTTVAAFLTMLDNGEVVAGGAGLNQQTVYGADVISRLAAAQDDAAQAERLHKLTVASINQAVDSLKLTPKLLQRVERVTIVCNPAMHHLLAQLPIDTLAGDAFSTLPKNINPGCCRDYRRYFFGAHASYAAATDWRFCRLRRAGLPGLF